MNYLAKKEEVTQVLAAFTDSVEASVPLAQVDQLRALIHKLTVDYNNLLKTTNDLTSAQKQVRLVIDGPETDWETLVKEDSTLVGSFQLINMDDLKDVLVNRNKEENKRRDHEWEIKLSEAIAKAENKVAEKYDISFEELAILHEKAEEWNNLKLIEEKYINIKPTIETVYHELDKFVISPISRLHSKSEGRIIGHRKLKRWKYDLKEMLEKGRLVLNSMYKLR